MTTSEELWIYINPIWRQYCGVSDEYRTVRDRWVFLSTEMGRALPKLSKGEKTDNDLTFDQLNRLVESMDKWFEAINLRRYEPEDLSKILPALAKIDFDWIKATTDAFFTLATYTGLIKHAFFQRTVSLGIPQLESSLPSSPERTMGNETFHIAADTVARRYSKCISRKYAEWDGFVTFSPAIGGEYFYGAFCKPTAELKLFHVSVSEEQKYYLGSYLTIAHELGHAAIASNSKTTEPPVWFKALYYSAMSEMIKIQSKHRQRKKCADCNLSSGGILQKIELESQLWRTDFEDFIADIIAYEIGGVNTISALLDFAPTVDICYIRAYGLLTFLCLRKPADPVVVQLLNRLRSSFERLRSMPPKNLKSIECLSCWRNIGLIWGQSVSKCPDPPFESVLSDIVTDRFRDIYKSRTSEQTRKKLTQGVSVCEIDPRIILHEYYDLLYHGMEPNYSATVYSLVMNES